MSKNTRNTAFRKVDVDQFEEEKYEEEVASDEGVTGPNDAEGQSLLSKYPLIADSLCALAFASAVYVKNPTTLSHLLLKRCVEHLISVLYDIGTTVHNIT